ncbi:RNA polymerase recycling motor HelD [Paenactinomyces guangxiensis]|uniref:UvrD-helicase domain-containing protein n=1 Tax=Paenactinomyces guangxiensis TaxID=1490290 RepID=A0A7W2AA25_9BACL|nr:RNA polymerase recycling motor HelD [Paenactinomyces guangxiensis]MBA4496340.1 UvrD-helicase domain-containing protein [Paenactinomyces guangxiensis]MBH8593624.1 UvrD-helicase domain-containing protein [Paenactinomyces guangxiensis]
MSTSDQDRQEEQKRVDWVVSKITKRMASLEQHVSVMKSDIVNIRKNFWDDVTVNLDDPGEAAETYASMKQQAEVLSERERTHRHARKQMETLRRLKQSPYFGRIDFREGGEQETERIYLGIASFFDEDKESFLVYDWRAPVSSLYYDYPPGPAQYEAPDGKVTGIMELKRQFIIRGGQIQSMFDTGVTIGDELLQEVLGKQADSQMKSIVATIQKEQNRIIRNERSRLLVVQGAAGSGKTSAALQRVAYLLYRYRETLRAENIVLFSPNPMFNSYISTVLPELGEENMQQTTFQDYLEHQLGQTFQLEDPFTQMEYTLAPVNDPGYEARIEGITYKAGNDFMQLIERYVVLLGREGMIFRDVKFRGETIISAERIKEHFYGFDSSLPISNRIRLLADWLLQELKECELAERTKPWVDEEIELLDNETYLRVYQKLRRKKGYREDTFDDFEREQKMLAAMVVKESFKPLRKCVKKLDFIDVPAIYRQLFARPQQILRFAPDARLPRHWDVICKQTVERLERSQLAYEDATPYLYLKERIEGFQTNTSVRHVFVDEAQDYSLFQFAYIKRLFPRSKMTVLGDLNQAIHPHTTSTGFAPLSSLYGEDQTETFVLTRSYRSTRQIVEFTRRLIDGGEKIEPFNREGSKPTLTQVSNAWELAGRLADRIRSLQSAGYRTIAVICKTARESREAHEMLQEQVPLTLIGKETASFEAGTLIIPSYLAKGVEFDAVIIYNSSQYERESERKLFYTACTRAMHELHIYSIGKMNPFITSVSPDTYVRES